MNEKARTIIENLDLQPHPEGGYYRETYRSDLMFDAGKSHERFTGTRCCSTCIYFLIEETNFSAFHRIKADEIWHFYSGLPLTVHVIHPDGSHEPIELGTDTEKGQVFQATVQAGRWFASGLSSGSGYALVGCTTAPGFEFEDFEMAGRDTLKAQYPQHAGLIDRFTRE
jgi:uncharacterized protein